ncbi:hypothetical protein FSP39_006428 [Pinctada imbricata]|uniref:Short-chain collagen C4-like n=1 Tax=Pinctada imbricata TaxID=66713 RepID=A0AA88XQ93_PINIB|nr:hypothetical protein FSP39_006428 [Pinctada imbricata]
MHHEPELLKKLSGTHAPLFGGEYNSASSLFGSSKLRDGDDIPCTVCQSRRGVQKLMIPARVTCSKGWTKQYAGYLATTYYVHKASAEYICMDQNPTASHGGHHNYNGALPYPVSAVCGALPCPPYKSGDTISCVVCTK